MVNVYNNAQEQDTCRHYTRQIYYNNIQRTSIFYPLAQQKC